MNVREWKRAMRDAVDEGRVSPLYDWRSFSDNLLTIYFSGDEDLYRTFGERTFWDVADAEPGSWRSVYKRVYNAYWSVMGPEPVPLARGMSGLCVPDEESFWDLAYGSRRTERKDTPYSQNIAFAARDFADLSGPSRRRMVRNGMDEDHWAQAEDSWDACAEAWQEAHGGSRAAATRKTETPVLICSRVKMPSGEWGGDSESGALQEAEIRVGSYPLDDIEKVFVLTAYKSGRLATSAERTEYCLGRWQLARIKVPPYMDDVIFRPFDITLHPKTRTAGVKHIGRVKKVDKSYADGRRWRCIYEA